MAAPDPPSWASPGPWSRPDAIPGFKAPPPGPVTLPSTWVPQPVPRPVRAPASPTAVAALVVSICAAAVACLTFFTSVVLEPVDEGDYGPYSLLGTLRSHPSGTPVRAAELQLSLTQLLSDDGWTVTTMTCPATETITAGTVTPCHAILDGDAWSVIVVFDDTTGRYTALVS